MTIVSGMRIGSGCVADDVLFAFRYPEWSAAGFAAEDNWLKWKLFGYEPSEATPTENPALRLTQFNWYARKHGGTDHGWGTLDMSGVHNLSDAFSFAYEFDAPVGDWDVSAVTSMKNTFYYASSFNQPLGSWDVGNTRNLSGMFSVALKFNQDLSGWNTSSVTDMSFCFGSATSFQGDISGWDTSNVTAMDGMFSQALAFNQDLSGWNTGNVRSMNNLLYGASSFDHSLGAWDISEVETMDNIFNGSGMSAGSLSDTFVGWAQTAASKGVRHHVVIGSMPHRSSSLTVAGRNATTYLREVFGWKINR